MKSVTLRDLPRAVLCLLLASVGCGSNGTPNSTPTPTPGPVLSSVSPSAASAGSPGVVLTATGSNFVPGSEITWNGTERATLYVSSTSLQTTLLTPDLANVATIQVGVTDPTNVGGASSSTIPFSISGQINPNPTPAISSISPSSATAGASDTTITVTGSNFISASSVTWNTKGIATTYQTATSLTAIIPASDLITAGTAQIAVVNPSPGGGTSNSVNFVINAVGGSGQLVVPLFANDLAWDPINQVMYLSLPSSNGANGNTVQIINPVTGALGASAFAGSEPDLLAVSANSKYLYASLDGSSNVQRFVLPALTPDISLSFGPASFYGPYVAMDLQASPAADATAAVVLGTPGTSPEEEGGVRIFDSAVQRPNYLCGWIQLGCSGVNKSLGLYDSIQWSSDASAMYALNNEDTGFDFYEVPVDAQGFGTVTDFGALAAGFGDAIHYDATTNRIYSNGGNVIDAKTGSKVGQFGASGIAIPDGKNGVIYFIGQSQSASGSTTYTIESFNIAHFTPIASMPVSNVIGFPTHFVRWGTNGLAFTTKNSFPGSGTSQQPGALYIVSGSFVSSAAQTGDIERPSSNVHRSWNLSRPTPLIYLHRPPAQPSN